MIYKVLCSVHIGFLFYTRSCMFTIRKDKIAKKMVGLVVILQVIQKLRGTLVVSVVGITYNFLWRWQYVFPGPSSIHENYRQGEHLSHDATGTGHSEGRKHYKNSNKMLFLSSRRDSCYIISILNEAKILPITRETLRNEETLVLVNVSESYQGEKSFPQEVIIIQKLL